MKIFQIGFNRCGTTSIFQFFKRNCTQLKCLHHDDGQLAMQMFKNHIKNKPLLDGKYQDHNVYTDMQAFIKKDGKIILLLAHMEYYQTLDKQYPNSKFILNTRNIENWIKSRTKHYSKNKWIHHMPDIYNTKDFTQTWRDQWNQHHQEVKEYFREKDNLLVFNIETDPGEKIAKFIPELIFKNTKFPKLN